MQRQLHSVSSLVLTAALSAAFGLAGCGGDKSAPDATGGKTSASGGSTGTSGGSTNTSSGGAVASGGAGGGSAYACSKTVPPNEKITDFSTYKADGTWGDSMSLTGGSFRYDSMSSDGVDMLTGTVVDGALEIKGDVTAYAGLGFWFGPCLDVSKYRGITFTLKGTMGDAALEMQVQSSHNYPISATDKKGECTGTWSDGCASNTKTITTDMISADTALVVEVLWADLLKGKPTAPVDPSEIMGVQWQFNCADGATCKPDVFLDDVKFMP